MSEFLWTCESAAAQRQRSGSIRTHSPSQLETERSAKSDSTTLERDLLCASAVDPSSDGGAVGERADEDLRTTVRRLDLRALNERRLVLMRSTLSAVDLLGTIASSPVTEEWRRGSRCRCPQSRNSREDHSPRRQSPYHHESGTSPAELLWRSWPLRRKWAWPRKE